MAAIDRRLDTFRFVAAANGVHGRTPRDHSESGCFCVIGCASVHGTPRAQRTQLLYRADRTSTVEYHTSRLVSMCVLSSGRRAYGIRVETMPASNPSEAQNSSSDAFIAKVFSRRADSFRGGASGNGARVALVERCVQEEGARRAARRRSLRGTRRRVGGSAGRQFEPSSKINSRGFLTRPRQRLFRVLFLD